jgi:hypothetical protein
MPSWRAKAVVYQSIRRHISDDLNLNVAVQTSNTYRKNLQSLVYHRVNHEAQGAKYLYPQRT